MQGLECVACPGEERSGLGRDQTGGLEEPSGRYATKATPRARVSTLTRLTTRRSHLGPSGETDFVLRALAAGYRACQSPGVHVLHHGFRTWKEGEVLRFSEAQPLASQLR